MSIEKLMYKSYNGEVASVAQAILQTSANNDWSADAYLSSLLDLLGTKEDLLTSGIKRNKIASILDEKDDIRDNHLRSLFHLINGYLHYPAEDVSTAAGAVSSILNKYGLSETIEENYAQESSLVESLIKDLEAPETQATIAKLPGISVCIDGLKTAQADFTTTFVTYAEMKAKLGSKDSATKIKTGVLKLINDDLVNYLRAMSKAMPEVYSDFSAATAQIIADNNDKVKKRGKKA